MSKGAIKTFHVLVTGGVAIDPDLQQWIDSYARVTRVTSFDEACRQMTQAPVDLIIARPADLELFTLSQPATTGEDWTPLYRNLGVAIVNRSGAFIQSNRVFEELPHEARSRIAIAARDVLAGAEGPTSGKVSMVRRTLQEGDLLLELMVAPVFVGPQPASQGVLIVDPQPESGGLRSKIDAIDRAGRELLSFDAEEVAALDLDGRLELLENRILRCVRDLLHFDNFEVRVLDRVSGRLNLVLSFGMPHDAVDDDIRIGGEGFGICGFVAAQGRSYICPDTAADPRYLPGIQNARSSLTVPLTLHDKIVGVANFESTKVAAFGETDRKLAEMFGRYVALALNLLELLVSERRTTTGQLGRHILAGITAPLNDLLTDVEALLEDYIGHDDLRHRLRCVSENVVKIRDTVRGIAQARPHVLGPTDRPAIGEDATLAGKRVLVADDEDIIRETVRDVLSGYGCEVSVAPDGETAIGLIAQRTFDLVLSDIRMPRGSGYEVFAATKNANPQTPVIFTTGFGYDPNHSIIRARREGLTAVLFKPFKVDQLLHEVRSALQSATK